MVADSAEEDGTPATLRTRQGSRIAIRPGPVASELLDLRALGVGIALDDFGVGHTSLTHLRRLPVEMLKLDRELTAGVGRDADDTGIVSAITTLAHILGMTVLAEGVERPEQVIGLRQAGCDAAQGFRFSRPLHPDVAAERLPDPVRTAVPWLARG